MIARLAAGIAVTGVLVACGPAASTEAAPSPSSGAVRTGQFAGTTNAGGRIEFTVTAIGDTTVLQVEYGDITEEGFSCTAPDGQVSELAEPAPTNFLSPTTIHNAGFDVEQTFQAGGYLEKLSVIGQFTSPTTAIGTAHSAVLSVDPPNAQCTLTRPALTWSAKLSLS